MDSAIARVIGGLYIAITTGMSEEAAGVAHEVLFRFADNPDVRPEDQRIYRLIALSASRPVDELKAENEQFERHSRFSLITGGAA